MPNTLAKHQIHALARAFDETTARKRLRNPTVAWLLPVAQVVDRDAFWEPAAPIRAGASGAMAMVLVLMVSLVCG